MFNVTVSKNTDLWGMQRESLPGCYYRDSDFCFFDDMTGTSFPSHPLTFTFAPNLLILHTPRGRLHRPLPKPRAFHRLRRHLRQPRLVRDLRRELLRAVRVRIRALPHARPEIEGDAADDTGRRDGRVRDGGGGGGGAVFGEEGVL